MKWSAYWWGIEIDADTEEDNVILNGLIDTLDKKAVCEYSAGDLEVNETDGLKTLVFYT